MHWADVVAEKLLESGKEHVISSGITPSGPIHLGSMREILTADAIVKAVNDKGGSAKLVYIADNADPLRKVYPFLDEEKYSDKVGLPLAEIPAPYGNLKLCFVWNLRSYGPDIWFYMSWGWESTWA